jgi:T4 bacteriophage base plate protein
MSLPKMMHPTFNVTIPSTKEKIRMRPFLVREEKILLMAQTSENPKDIVLAIQQVVNNCIVDSLSVDELTTFDIEYLFLKLRGKSVGNTIELKYTDPSDEHRYDIIVNVDDVEVKFEESHTNKVEITEKSGIILKYPKADVTEKLAANITSEVQMLFDLMKYCIGEVYDESNVYVVSDYTDQQIDEFLEALDISTFKKIQNFIETMPKLYHEVSYTRKDGSEGKVVLQTLNDFFTLR